MDKKYYLVIVLQLLQNGKVIAKHGGTSTCKRAENIAAVCYTLLGYILAGVLGDFLADKLGYDKNGSSVRVRVRAELHFDGVVLESESSVAVRHDIAVSTYSVAGIVISGVLNKALNYSRTVKEAS